MEKKYLVWIHHDYEGWSFQEFNTLKEARAYALRTHSESYPPKVTKLV